MDIYVIHTIWRTNAAVQFVEKDEPTARQLFEHLTEKYLSRCDDESSIETETFDWQETKTNRIDGVGPIEYTNNGPDVIKRATIKDKDGQTVETVELYRAIV